MMFKFYQPTKKEVKVIKVTAKMGAIFLDDEYDLLAELSREEAAALMLDIAKALGHNKIVFGSIPPEPDDPALMLARRIASIAAETGLKPRLVYNIVNHIDWQEEDKAEKASAAAAPKENPTGGE
jgi:hypothetical protein